MSTGAVSQKNAAYFQAVVPGNSWMKSYSNSSVQGPAFDSTTTLICIFCSQDCWVAVGANPTAAIPADATKTTSMFLPAGIVDFLGVNPGDKIAVIRSSADGILYVREGS